MSRVFPTRKGRDRISEVSVEHGLNDIICRKLALCIELVLAQIDEKQPV